MIRSEILEFLELSEKAADADIRRRAHEKQAFFSRLLETAPNQTLKGVHARNLEKIEQIFKLFGGTDEEERLVVAAAPPVYAGAVAKEVPQHQLKPVGWLIRHTEQMQTKSFPFYVGKTVIGRESVSGFQAILLEGDPYVSRQHALLEVTVAPIVSVQIRDGWQKPSKNGVYLNSNPERLQAVTRLRNNDTVQIGNTKLILRLADEQQNLSYIEKEVSDRDYMKTVIINLL